jgi:hypothetical protein
VGYLGLVRTARRESISWLPSQEMDNPFPVVDRRETELGSPSQRKPLVRRDEVILLKADGFQFRPEGKQSDDIRALVKAFSVIIAVLLVIDMGKLEQEQCVNQALRREKPLILQQPPDTCEPSECDVDQVMKKVSPSIDRCLQWESGQNVEIVV